MTRKPEATPRKALAALGAEVVTGDLDDAASLERALAGAWGVLRSRTPGKRASSGRRSRASGSRELARERGVQHFVYTSVGSAHRKTGIPHFENKWRIEETVRGAGIPLVRDPAAGVLHGEPAVARGSSRATSCMTALQPDDGAADDRRRGHRQVRRAGVRSSAEKLQRRRGRHRRRRGDDARGGRRAERARRQDAWSSSRSPSTRCARTARTSR